MWAGLTSERVQYLIAHHHTYDNIDGIDYQILVEADFLVNIMEDSLSKEAALNAYHSIFKTECGKKICKETFLHLQRVSGTSIVFFSTEHK